MFDKYPSLRKITVATGLFAGALALTGCASTNGASDSNESYGGNSGATTDDFKVERQFTVSGKMITNVIGNNGYKEYVADKTLSYCEGGDLVEVSNWNDLDSRQRSENHHACKDGKLTKEDFPS